MTGTDDLFDEAQSLRDLLDLLEQGVLIHKDRLRTIETVEVKEGVGL